MLTICNHLLRIASWGPEKVEMFLFHVYVFQAFYPCLCRDKLSSERGFQECSWAHAGVSAFELFPVNPLLPVHTEISPCSLGCTNIGGVKRKKKKRPQTPHPKPPAHAEKGKRKKSSLFLNFTFRNILYFITYCHHNIYQYTPYQKEIIKCD